MRMLELLESLADRVSTVGYGRNRISELVKLFLYHSTKGQFSSHTETPRFETANLLPVNRSSMV